MFYDEFRVMLKNTYEKLKKYERINFYPKYEREDLSKITQIDICYPQDTIETKKELIEQIFSHPFWKKRDLYDRFIEELEKKLRKTLYPSVVNKLDEASYGTLAMEFYSFQFTFETKQEFPVEAKIYNKSIEQQKYDSCFFIKNLFSSGEKRISKCIGFNENNEIYECLSKKIFNIYRSRIYNNFYNEFIKPKITNENEIRINDDENKIYEKGKEDVFEDTVLVEFNYKEQQTDIKDKLWSSFVKYVEDNNSHCRLLFSKKKEYFSLFRFIQSNISCTDLEGREEPSYKKLDRNRIIDIRTKLVFIYIFHNDFYRWIKRYSISTSSTIKEDDIRSRLIPECDEYNYVLLQNEYSPRKHLSQKEKFTKILKNFVDGLEQNNDQTVDLFKSFLEHSFASYELPILFNLFISN